ncbi:helix-turn-helix domain-containing protein [Streptomyces sp. NPDC051907]|uniref:AraC-like ligand-binding domain-containing protein n=1 Tax=Streptomyces sp. NPDC051907 TaxID=3155284 RepID=UPI00344AAD2E
MAGGRVVSRATGAESERKTRPGRVKVMAYTFFDSTTLPTDQRFDWWCETVNQSVSPTRQTSSHAADFTGSVAFLTMGPVQTSTLAFPAVQSQRTAGLIRQSDPETYELTLVLGGQMWISQNRNEVQATAGEFLMWSSSRPYAGRALSGAVVGASRAIIVHLPRGLLPLPDARIDELLARGLPAADGMGAVLARHLCSVMEQGPALTEPDCTALGPVTLDLASAFLAHRLGLLSRVQPESRARMLLARIDHFIDANLTDPTLSPADIAARHHIALRTLHALFRQRERTVSATIRHRRLEGARADLADPRSRTVPVHAIAARWGFTDAGLFSRAFRSAYGSTPKDHRRRATADPAASSPPRS